MFFFFVLSALAQQPASPASAAPVLVATGENILEQTVALPGALDADRSVVMMAFKRRHQADSELCYPLLSSAAAEVDTVPWELLMLPTAMPGFARGLMRRGLVGSTAAGPRQERKLMVFGDVGEARELLGIPDDEQVQVMVVDRAGQVLWRQAGPCTTQLHTDLRAALRK